MNCAFWSVSPSCFRLLLDLEAHGCESIALARTTTAAVDTKVTISTDDNERRAWTLATMATAYALPSTDCSAEPKPEPMNWKVRFLNRIPRLLLSPTWLHSKAADYQWFSSNKTLKDHSSLYSSSDNGTQSWFIKANRWPRSHIQPPQCNIHQLITDLLTWTLVNENLVSS